MQTQTTNSSLPFVLYGISDHSCQQITGGARSESRSFSSNIGGEAFVFTNENGVIRQQGVPPTGFNFPR